MKQLQKSDLKEGEIYKANSTHCSYIFKATNNLKNVKNIPSYNKFMKQGDFNGSYLTFTNATLEEKHWLETCIKADQFVSYEEAMKTFIPEYVECVEEQPQYDNYGELGKIYKVLDWNYSISDCMLEGTTSGSTAKKRFKPSTKEAYDAQFVVKEPEFVLPKRWAIIITNENKDIVNNYRKSIFNNTNISCNLNVNNVHLSDRYDGTYYHYNKYYFKEHTRCEEITTKQFKQYVLKEEKETVTIKTTVETKSKFINNNTVETSEGSIFKVGDLVTPFENSSPNKGKKFKITGFRWNNSQTEICAITNLHKPYGIGVEKLEIYLESRVKTEIVENFVLPEKWCVEVNDKICNKFGYYEAYGYHHSIKVNQDNKWSENIKEGFTEITFEQFKKYVLKDE